MANGSSDLPTLLGVASGIAVLAGLICMVLHLFSKNKYPRHRGHFADTHLPPPILYSSDTGMRLLWLRCRLSDCPRALLLFISSMLCRLMTISHNNTNNKTLELAFLQEGTTQPPPPRTLQMNKTKFDTLSLCDTYLFFTVHIRHVLIIPYIWLNTILPTTTFYILCVCS